MRHSTMPTHAPILVVFTHHEHCGPGYNTNEEVAKKEMRSGGTRNVAVNTTLNLLRPLSATGALENTVQNHPGHCHHRGEPLHTHHCKPCTAGHERREKEN
ncbi:hypothetical protein TRVL_01185 [Trypanosoma vivax]|nr:hypothetical protein TRVL_01185 [Trypanosoma vivax]